ncbi:MAG TPA: hypothetical protein PLC79_02445 [Phycisphaerae bacterium]|nr:hypothetical protein [Phycisphaerae bacterium]
MRWRSTPVVSRGGAAARFAAWLVGGLSVACLLSAAEAYVYYNSSCSTPTPYPPPGAAWGGVNNPDFESGFTNGVANQWAGWNNFGGTVHYAGTAHVTSGTYSQELDLPASTECCRSAGISQQFYAVVGGTYTVTARIYLQEPAGEDYPGQDLVGQLGVDPWGEVGLGGAAVWSDEVATKGVWQTKTVTVTAQLPVITVGLKATRKTVKYAGTVQAWFDQITITGPVPTDPPPGPEPDPVDPETLIPATTGANLVTNPSFEQTFTDGVSAGWTKWSTMGTGVWEQSLRVGKVGGGRYDCGGEDALVQMNPKTILLLCGDPEILDPGTFGTLDYLKDFANIDDTIIVGRPYIDQYMHQWLYESDPVQSGRHLADQLYSMQRLYPRIDCWQGLNEPDHGDTFPVVLAFEKAFADRLHERGMKSCSLNLAVGNPGNIWKMIAPAAPGYPSCRDLMEVADYLGHHCYGGPNDDLMVTNQVQDNVCDAAMRPRRFKDMYDRRGWRLPPVIATEGGADVQSWGETRAAADLTAMGDYMQFNRWWCGYTNFVVGGACGWGGGFDIAGYPAVISAVGEWNYNHPADAVDGFYSQKFGSGKIHPKTLPELTADGDFDGGVCQQVSGLGPGQSYLLSCWMKYAFRGMQPTSLRFYLGVDQTGQTTDGRAATINWGIDQIADKAPIHEIFSHAWRAFTAQNATVSIWLRANQTVTDPSFRVYADQVELRQLTASAPPLISVTPPTISIKATQGTNPRDQVLVVANGGLGTVSYTISDDATWLSVSPTSGTATVQTDVITLHCETASLPVNTYTATITVVDPAVGNSPQRIPVTLTVAYAPADFDRDADVDLTDFALFQGCFNGPNHSPQKNCAVGADLDQDADVDLADFSVFQACFNGPNRAPRCPN